VGALFGLVAFLLAPLITPALAAGEMQMPPGFTAQI